MLKKIIGSIMKYWSSSKTEPKQILNNVEERKNDVWHDLRDIKDSNFEFLIRRINDFEFSDDFDIASDDYEKILTPNTLNFTDFHELEYEFCRYKIHDSKVFITDEFAGIVIVIENNGIQREVVKKIMQEVRGNIQDYTKHKAQIFEV